MGQTTLFLIPGGIIQMTVSVNLLYANFQWVFKRETDWQPACFQMYIKYVELMGAMGVVDSM